MEHKTITGKSGSVHYWVSGHGKQTILFTHGATMDHGMFQHQVDHFARDHQVITWDVPAHGRSRPYAGFTLKQAAEDLITILYAEKVKAAHLVGQSMGGYIAQIVARDHPDRVLSFTAVGSSPMQPSYFSAMDTWLLSIAPAILRLYPYRSLIKTIATQISVDEQAQDYALKTLQTYTKAEIADIMGVVYRGVQEFGQDQPLSVPILLTYGTRDKTGKVQAYCQQWAESEQRPLKEIPNAAHNANMDNPEDFNSILADFIEQV